MATITLDTLDGTSQFTAYRADPAETPRAAIVVIQEIFGAVSYTHLTLPTKRIV